MRKCDPNFIFWNRSIVQVLRNNKREMKGKAIGGVEWVGRNESEQCPGKWLGSKGGVKGVRSKINVYTTI